MLKIEMGKCTKINIDIFLVDYINKWKIYILLHIMKNIKIMFPCLMRQTHLYVLTFSSDKQWYRPESIYDRTEITEKRVGTKFISQIG